MNQHPIDALQARKAAIAAFLEKSRAENEKTIAAQGEGMSAPLSFGQESLWLLDKLGAGPAYNISVRLTLRGTLDRSALEAALAELVQRHRILRSRIVESELQVLQVADRAQSVAVRFVNLSDFSEPEQRASFAQLSTHEAEIPFDLRNDVLYRFCLVGLNPQHHVLLMTVHHIIWDGWSGGVMGRELGQLYAAFAQGSPSPLAPLAIQYGDYAAWQRLQVEDNASRQKIEFWKEELRGAPKLLALPTDRPRPPVQSYCGAEVCFSVPADTLAGLHAVSRERQATLYMTLMAAFSILLARYSGQADICVGTPVANRNRSELDCLIGFFVNTLAIRTYPNSDLRFESFLQQVKSVVKHGYANQDIPFERVVDALKPDRSLARSPLFQVMFALQSPPLNGISLPGLELQLETVATASAKVDLALNLCEEGGELKGSLEYSTDLFDGATVSRIGRHFTKLLESIVENPACRIFDLAMFDDVERRKILEKWNATAVDISTCEPVHCIVEAQVQRTPMHAAIACEDGVLSYREMNSRANRLARRLRAMGAGPDVLVGICMERTPDLIVALMAVLKSGGVYLPLDPSYPVDRLSYMIDDARPLIVLTQRPESAIAACSLPVGTRICSLADQGAALESLSDANLGTVAAPHNLAYVIYTSGSTGKPKGVMLSHHGLYNMVLAQRKLFSPNQRTRILQFASFNFDASTWEIFMALANGATLCMASPEQLMPGALERTIASLSVNMATLPPVVLRVLQQNACGGLENLVTAGEACPQSLVSQWGKQRNFYNAYGPTESTVCATVQLCETNSMVAPSIGRPIANTQIYVLDPFQNPVAEGVTGELHIAGEGLARGYLRRPGLTAEKFIPNPFSVVPGSRMYRSGDLARYLPGGEIEYLGRIDSQVKIRGFRIELGEIEATLRLIPGIQSALVTALESASGDKRLLAYIVQQPEVAPIRPAHLREFLVKALPDYMVPSHFIELAGFPMTSNGKIDHKALPLPDIQRNNFNGDSEGTHIPPRTNTEASVADILTQVLDLDRVGMNDNFFSLGGHSLLATKVVSRIRTTFQIDVPLRALFESPTAAELARRVDLALQEFEEVDI